MKFVTSILAVAAIAGLFSCDKEAATTSTNSFLGKCFCSTPYVEDVANDTCVYDPTETDWGPINGDRFTQKLSPGEQLVVFAPLDPNAERTWEIPDTLVRDKFIVSNDGGWFQTIRMHSDFRRADHYCYASHLNHPTVENYYDTLRPFLSGFGNKYWSHMAHIRMSPTYTDDPPVGTTITWTSVTMYHPKADTILINGGIADGRVTVGPDTSHGIIAYRNAELVPGPGGDTSYARCRIKFFDPPPRLRNEEW